MFSIYFFTRKGGEIVFLREVIVETIREKNRIIEKAGATPGQWLDIPGAKAQIAWI